MYLLDTNHCSRLIDGHPAIVARLRALGDVAVATCVIVRGELAFMVERSEQNAENSAKVAAFLRDIEVFPVDDAAADTYGDLKSRLLSAYGPREKRRRRGVRLEQLGFDDNDLWIAAIAIRRGHTVVSADESFGRMTRVTDLPVERWWSPEGRDRA